MLTPQMIDAMNKATGNNVPLDAKPGMPPSRADQIRAIGQKALADKNAAPTETTSNAPSYIQDVSAEQKAGVNKIGESINKGANNMQKGAQEGGWSGAGKMLMGAAESGFGTISGAAQTVLAPITPAINNTVRALTPAFKALNPNLVKAYDAVSPMIKDLQEKHPEAATLTGDIINALLLGIGGGAAEAPLKSAAKEAFTKEAIQGVKESLVKDVSGGITATKGLLTKSPESIAAEKLSKIQDMVSPKMNAKEIKLAQSQGRIVSGKEPTLLRSGTPDTVIPSDKVVRSAETINREIPMADTMKSPELYTALEARTGDMATKLKPEMQKVAIKPETIEKISNDWKSVKEKQLADAPATEEINVAKRQRNFEAFLQKSKSGTLDDLWNTRIEYDRSIKPNVKQANNMSSESLQMQKEEWLQNREVLNKVINDEALGLGETSKQAFSDMTDMYHAKENLLSKANLSMDIKPNKIIQWMKDHPYITTAVGGAVIGSTGIPKTVLDVATGGAL